MWIHALAKKKFNQKRIGLLDSGFIPPGRQREKIFPSPFSFNAWTFYDLISGKTRKKEALSRYEDQQQFVDRIRTYYGNFFLPKRSKYPKRRL